MKYDELYTRVEVIWNKFNQSPEMTALFNVVKMHKPYEFNWSEDTFISCRSCGDADYPCKTIQMIDRDLL